jgi:hypothetical protein
MSTVFLNRLRVSKAIFQKVPNSADQLCEANRLTNSPMTNSDDQLYRPTLLTNSTDQL